MDAGAEQVLVEADAKAKAKAEYATHPRVRLQKVVADLRKVHIGVEDRYNSLRAGLLELTSVALELVPEPPADPDATNGESNG